MSDEDVGIAEAAPEGMTEAQLSKMVVDAASALDVIDSAWYTKIDVEALDMDSGRYCIGGQLGYPMYAWDNIASQVRAEAAEQGHFVSNFVFATNQARAGWIAQIQERMDNPVEPTE